MTVREGAAAGRARPARSAGRLLSNARNHIDEADPERTDETDEQLLARAEKQFA